MFVCLFESYLHDHKVLSHVVCETRAVTEFWNQADHLQWALKHVNAALSLLLSIHVYSTTSLVLWR